MLNNELFILSIITLSFLGLLAILLVYLMVRKAIDIKKRREIEVYKDHARPLIFMMLTEESYSRELTVETVIHQKAIEELLSKFVKILEGEQEKQRLTGLATLYLTDYYQKRLKSNRWSYRMNALYHIEDFNMSVLLPEIVKLTKKTRVTHEELVHVLRILASFQYLKINDLLTTRFFYLSEYEYRNILIRLEQDKFDRFVLKFHKSNHSLQKAILDVISIKKDLNYLSFTENIFSIYSGEVKLRALKALAEIGYVKQIEPYLELLYSPIWQERMMTAKLVGAIKEDKGIRRLIELLHDQTWWVRFQAGQAICQFPNGKDILQRVLETSKDSFAKDMAWEWLHKGV